MTCPIPIPGFNEPIYSGDSTAVRREDMPRGKKVAEWIAVSLVVAIIALQAASKLISGNIFYTNYKNLPLNVFGALIVVAAVLIAGMVYFWRNLNSE
jgi:hypothetical protein